MQGGVDAADHLVDVVDAAAQIRIVHACEHRGDAVALQAQRVVGGVAAGADQFVQALQQFRIVEQQRVQVEELADFVRQRAVQALAQRVHLAAHGVDGARAGASSSASTASAAMCSSSTSSTCGKRTRARPSALPRDAP